MVTQPQDTMFRIPDGNRPMEVRKAFQDVQRILGIIDEGSDSSSLYIYVVDSSGNYVVDSSGNYVTAGLTVGHSEIDDDEPERHAITDREALAGVDIDMDEAGIFTKTLATGDTTFTISNPRQGHAVLAELTPVAGSTITLPATCTTIKGSFDDSGVNYLAILCVDSTTPAYLVTINKDIS